MIDGSDPPEHPGHTITVAPGSRLAAALGDRRRSWVNSYHHQAVDRLGDGVVPVAWAEDGILEALELEGDAWVLGVQWELQESWKTDERFLAVFAAFVRRRAPGRRQVRPARQLVEQRGEQAHEAPGRRDVQPLARRVRPLDLGAERDRVDAGPLGGDDRGLEAAVGERHLGLGAEQRARATALAAASSGEARSGRQPG